MEYSPIISQGFCSELEKIAGALLTRGGQVAMGTAKNLANRIAETAATKKSVTWRRYLPTADGAARREAVLAATKRQAKSEAAHKKAVAEGKRQALARMAQPGRSGRDMARQTLTEINQATGAKKPKKDIFGNLVGPAKKPKPPTPDPSPGSGGIKPDRALLKGGLLVGGGLVAGVAGPPMVRDAMRKRQQQQYQ